MIPPISSVPLRSLLITVAVIAIIGLFRTADWVRHHDHEPSKRLSIRETTKSLLAELPAQESKAKNTTGDFVDNESRQNLISAYAKLPMSFEVNEGQTSKQVKFLARGSNYSLFLTSTEAVLALNRTTKTPGTKSKTELATRGPMERRGDEKGSVRNVLRMAFVGANPSQKVEGIDELPGKSNYFLDNAAKWHTELSTYAKVRYEGVYPGVDVIYYGSQGQLEYDLVIAPNANYKQIKLEYRGAKRLRIDKSSGDLILTTRDGGELHQQKPVVYQEICGDRHVVEGRYQLLGKHEISFRIADYDSSIPLVIDPVLSYSTLLGGTAWDVGYGIAVDSAGSAYVTGFTESVDFPMTHPLQGNLGGGHTDAFVAKLNSSGTSLIYSTYFGGNGNEHGYGIKVDDAGAAYICGLTTSTNLPTVHAPQSTAGGEEDGFIAKLDGDGSALLYSTYLGGTADERCHGIAIDSSGNAYVTGYTYSSNFPTANAMQPAIGGTQDGFVTKVSDDGSTFMYSTFIGGSNYDGANDVAVDSAGSAYVVGTTGSDNFPKLNPLQPLRAGGGDVFVTKFNASGSALIYSTYLGGTLAEEGYGIAVDAAGNAYVTGATDSFDFPTVTPYQSSKRGNYDTFLTELSPSGLSLIYSSYLGGTRADVGYAVALDGSGNVYVVGETSSLDFPVANPIQTSYGGGNLDDFVFKLNVGSNQLLWSTYLGGSDDEEYPQGGFGPRIAVDLGGGAYVTGGTSSTNFPVKAGSFQTTFRGGGDAFIAKIGDAATPTKTSCQVQSSLPSNYFSFPPPYYDVNGLVVPVKNISGSPQTVWVFDISAYDDLCNRRNTSFATGFFSIENNTSVELYASPAGVYHLRKSDGTEIVSIDRRDFPHTSVGFDLYNGSITTGARSDSWRVSAVAPTPTPSPSPGPSPSPSPPPSPSPSLSPSPSPIASPSPSPSPVPSPSPCITPTILTQPGSQTVFVNQAAVLTVTASGTGPFSYQWYKGGKGDTSHPIGIASSVSTINLLSSIPDHSTYWVRIADNCANTRDSESALVAVTDKKPLILIPGITGTYLDDLSGKNLWPHGTNEDQLKLTLDPKEHQISVTPTDVLRQASFCFRTKKLYSPLIDMLTDINRGGFREDGKHPNPTLFIFAYDWRLGNDANALALRDYVKYVKSKYPNSKVDMLAHSMGGLLARRYILDNLTPADDNFPRHSVSKLIAIGSPWLGVPKMNYAMETGEFIEDFWGLGQLCVISYETLKKLAEFFPSVHQLLPSPSYFRIGGSTFIEEGWDINGNGNPRESYSREQFLALLKNRFHSNPDPVSDGDKFHTDAQDDWRNDGFGVSYLIIYGRQKRDHTIRQLVAKNEMLVCSFSGLCNSVPVQYIDPQKGTGDGTVPLISAERIGTDNLNSPTATLQLITDKRFIPIGNDPASHLGMLANSEVHDHILEFLNSSNPGSNVKLSTQTASTTASESESSFYVRILGAQDVKVADASGNSTDPLSEVADSGLPEVLTSRMGPGALLIETPDDQTYSITVRTGTSPLAIRITRGTDSSPKQAVRYQDLTLPVASVVRIRLIPGDVEDLRYDKEGDGVFETIIQPTVSVSGVAAQDIDSPMISIRATRQANNAVVTISSSDSGSGVKAAYYSPDGTHFQQYAAPFNVDLGKVSTISAFADDNVSNRSGLLTFALPAPVIIQYNSAAYSAGEVDGTVNISVTRLGDNSSPATVTYTTSNGTAKEGKDYVAAQGFLSFAAGETNKTFPVLIIDNAFVDGARTVNLTLSDPSGSTLSTQSGAVLTISDNDIMVGTNPLDVPRSFVQYDYYDFLGRYPDQSGWDFWTSQISNCGSNLQCIEVQRINVSASFFLSIEFQQTGYLVERFYKVAFGNANGNSTFGGTHVLPVPIIRFDEFLSDSQRIGRGVVVLAPGWEQLLASNKQAYAQEFVQTLRFVNAFPTTMTPAEFVDKLNQNAGNVLSASERTTAINLFGGAANSSNTTARAQAVRQVAEDADLYNAEYNRAFVLAEYYGYLRRNPNDAPESTLDYTGYDFWLTKLNQFNGNYINAEMVKAFLSSIEYRQRFGP